MYPHLLYYIFPSITVIFTTILLIIIYKKTPRYMKSYKFYVFQNVSFTLCSEIGLLICPCIFSHPLIQLEPIGLTKNFNYKIMLAICSLSSCCYCAGLDCGISMLFERYFSLKAGILHENSPKIPLIIYGILIFTDSILLLICFCCIFISPINDMFRSSTQNGFEFPAYIFPISLVTVIISVLLRLGLIIVGTILNAKISQSLKSQSQTRHLSSNVQKSNETFRRLIFIQFSGFFMLISCPMLFIIFSYAFLKETSNIPNYSIFGILAFGFYDTFFTAFFIKPYKKVLFYPFTSLKKRILPENTSNISLVTLQNH